MRPIKIITVEKSRELEQRAHAAGMSFADMMENAGRLTAEAMARDMPLDGARVVVLVGPGNNGGDGLVAAHYLAQRGALVTCYIWQRKPDDDPNLRRVEAGGLPVIWAEDDGEFEALRGLVSGAWFIVDALLGVGVARPIDGLLKDILDVVRAEIELVHERWDLVGAVPPGDGGRPWVVAVDCPTGLNCDSGELDPAALAADTTVTFAYPKQGLLRFPGADAVGTLIVADIGLPGGPADSVDLELATAAQVRAWLPRRSRAAHKGTFGRALIVAGSVNYAGAAGLAGAAATRVGAGLVTLGLPPPIQPAVAAQVPEVTYLLLPHDMGVIAPAAVDVLRDKMGDYEALLLGPGLTHEQEAVGFVRSLLGVEQQRETRGRIGFVAGAHEQEPERLALPPPVIDADGLNALAGGETDAWWVDLPPGTILTPHPGEMARLMGGGTTAAAVQADREGTARRMAAQWNAVVVLKGAFTVVAAPDGRLSVLPFANAGLATAGSGDVLAGAIVGLRAQGLDPFEAAVCGAYAHGLAGELAKEDLGDMGMVAGDLLLYLPTALARIRGQR